MEEDIRQRATWSSIQDVSLAALPVILVAIIGFGTWVTSELYSAQYTATTALREGVRIEASAKEFTADRYDNLLSEINRLRESVEKLNRAQAEMLTEIRMLRDQ